MKIMKREKYISNFTINNIWKFFLSYKNSLSAQIDSVVPAYPGKLASKHVPMVGQYSS